MAKRESPPRESAPAVGLGYALAWATLALPPLIVDAAAGESFRLPKLLASEVLALAALLALSLERRSTATPRPPHHRVLWAVLPLVAVATASLWTTSHPAHARDAVIDLAIGAACLVGFAIGLSSPRLLALLRLLIWPAALLAALAILQQHHLLEAWGRPTRAAGRDAVSLAGNVGDLGLYLVLPCLIEACFLRWGRRSDRLRLLALAVCLGGIFVTQTLTAIVALGAGALVLAPWRRPRPRALAAFAAGLAAVAIMVALVSPGVYGRVRIKARQAARGHYDSLLSGRTVAWRAATAMLAERPWLGVGFGAYAPEFLPTKLALPDRPSRGRRHGEQRSFANAHNEYLGVAAELGAPGVLALGWGAALVAAAAFSRGREGPAAPEWNRERRLAMSGVVAIAVTALTWFPFHTALVAYPMVVFLAWVFRRDAEARR